jgi:hypothetical protein
MLLVIPNDSGTYLPTSPHIKIFESVKLTSQLRIFQAYCLYRYTAKLFLANSQNAAVSILLLRFKIILFQLETGKRKFLGITNRLLFFHSVMSICYDTDRIENSFSIFACVL